MFRKAALAAAFLGLNLIAGSASALCIDPAEDGGWRNVDAGTRSITRVNVDFTCQDTNVVWAEPETSWKMRLWGSCSPSDCDWGRATASRLGSGWLYSYYDQGFAKRHVYARMTGGDKLRVYIRTDFTDPGRADYTSDNYFVRH